MMDIKPPVKENENIDVTIEAVGKKGDGSAVIVATGTTSYI